MNMSRCVCVCVLSESVQGAFTSVPHEAPKVTQLKKIALVRTPGTRDETQHTDLD
jgi:hypothetical protein